MRKHEGGKLRLHVWEWELIYSLNVQVFIGHWQMQRQDLNEIQAASVIKSRLRPRRRTFRS